MAQSKHENPAYSGRWSSEHPRYHWGPRAPQGHPQQGPYQQADPQQPPLQPAPAGAIKEKEEYFFKGKHGGLIFEACPDEHFVDNVWRVSTHEPFPHARDLTRSIKLEVLSTNGRLELKEALLQNDESTSSLGYTLIVPPESYELMYIGHKEQRKVYEILLKLKAPTLRLTSSMLMQSSPKAPHPHPPSYVMRVYLLGWVRRHLLENSNFLRIQVPNARQNVNVIKFHPDIERVLRSAHSSRLANPPLPPPPPAAPIPPPTPPAQKAVLPSRPAPTTPVRQPLPPVVSYSPLPSPEGPSLQPSPPVVRLPPPSPQEERRQQLIGTANQGPNLTIFGSLPMAEVEARYQAACVRLGPRGAARLEEVRQLIAELHFHEEEDIIAAVLEGLRLARIKRQQGG